MPFPKPPLSRFWLLVAIVPCLAWALAARSGVAREVDDFRRQWRGEWT